MKRDNLISYMSEPALLDQLSLPEVEELIKTFPYFQTAHMLLARNHHNLDSLRFHDMLRSAAAYAGDRTVLYHLIHENPAEPDQVDKEEGSKLTDRLEDILNRDTQPDELVMPPAYSLEDIPVVSEITEEISPKEEKLSSDQESVPQHPKIEEYTFTGWFDHVQETSEESLPVEDEGSPISRQGLIDKFLEESPRIKQDPEQKADNEDRSEVSGKTDDTPMTETLAKIYARQGKYKKAIYAYEKLSLKYPEKSTYFATQINRIKNNLEENS